MIPTRKSKAVAIVHQPAAQLYERLIADIKQRIRTAQIKAALAANAELILHYWEIGRAILVNQKREGWGTKVIDRLAADLQREFPKLAGYSARNLKYMRSFAEAWPDRAIVHQLGAQIPWKHNCVLLDRVKNDGIREFYIRKTVEHGWSRSVLADQLDTELHKRAGKAPDQLRAHPAIGTVRSGAGTSQGSLRFQARAAG
jgi:predicted nuclease of restriction endonuclease-like (RecB) superfamily